MGTVALCLTRVWQLARHGRWWISRSSFVDGCSSDRETKTTKGRVLGTARLGRSPSEGRQRPTYDDNDRTRRI